MTEDQIRETDHAAVLSGLWKAGTALASEAAAAIDELTVRLKAAEARADAAERDRDYWLRQHDLVMADWKADLKALTEARSAPPGDGEGDGDASADYLAGAALNSLLRFYDARTGAVSSRHGEDFLSDAFARAAKIAGAPPALRPKV